MSTFRKAAAFHLRTLCSDIFVLLRFSDKVHEKLSSPNFQIESTSVEVSWRTDQFFQNIIFAYAGVRMKYMVFLQVNFVVFCSCNFRNVTEIQTHECYRAKTCSRTTAVSHELMKRL